VLFRKTNKKGMMDDLFDMLVTAIAGFFVLFLISKALSFAPAISEEMTLERLDNLEAQSVLVNYLQSPVLIDGQQSSISDLITQVVNNGDYELFKAKTNSILGIGDNYYTIIIYDKKKLEAAEKGDVFVLTPEDQGLKAIADRPGWQARKTSRARMTIDNPTNKDVPQILVSFVWGHGYKVTEAEGLEGYTGGL